MEISRTRNFLPNCLVVFRFRWPIFEEAILAHIDSNRRLRNSEYRETHLLEIGVSVATTAERPPTFETQGSMILGMSNPESILCREIWMIQKSHVPVASPMSSHKWRETVFEYRCFFRYRETPARNLSSPTNFDSMRRTGMAALETNRFSERDERTRSSFGV